MSGRPSRNCKRRSASEMLGKTKKDSESAAAASPKKPRVAEPKPVQKVKERVSQKATPKKSKAKKVEAPQAVEEEPVISTKNTVKTYSSKRKRPTRQPKEAEAAPPDEIELPQSAEEADTSQEVIPTQEETNSIDPAAAVPTVDSSLDTAAVDSSLDTTVVDSSLDTAVVESSLDTAVVESSLDTAVVESSLDTAEEMGLVEESVSDTPAPTAVDEPPQDEQESRISEKAAGVSFGGRSIVSKASSVEMGEGSLQIAEMEQPQVTSEVVESAAMDTDALVIESLPGDGLTILEDGKDRNTLPERTEQFDEEDLISLPTEEVVITEHFKSSTRVELPKIPLPKKKMVITANYKTVQADIEETNVKEGALTSTSNLPVVVPLNTGLPSHTVSKVTNPPVPVPAAAEPSATKAPVTKTYIVGKNNTIQEVIMGKDNTVQEVISTDSVDVAPKVPAGDSDDEEYEYEDEEDRIKQEGLELNEDVLFCDVLMEDYVVDDLVMAVFQKIKPQDSLEQHYTADDDSGYKCNHCIEDAGKLELKDKIQMVRHLKDEHVKNYAPWQCPICQFKCVYPGSLLLHMSMHTKNKPFECTQCNKKFAYQQKLLKHYDYHNSTPAKGCHYCKSVNKNVVFHEQASLEGHIVRRHTPPIKRIYEGDNKAIIQESANTTSLGEALQLLASSDGRVKANPIYRLEKSSIKISDMGEIVEIPRNIVTSSAGGAGDSGLPISVVSTDPDMIGNPSSVVQIMPVSFRNESGMPETINVVITVPPNEGAKLMTNDGSGGTTDTTAKAGEWELPKLQVNSPDWHTRAKMNAVDKELLNHCVVLDQPIHYRNQRAFIKCTECPKGMEVHFGSVTQFCEHLRKDHCDKDIKPYKCSQCNYTCRVKGNLDQHIKFHSTERPYTCTMCGKGFIQKYKLNLHLKFHDNRREWSCEDCGSAFNDKQDLSRHRKNVHFKKEEGVPCPHCTRVFKNEYMLSQHIHVHTGERNYKCSICEKSYSTRESLRSHMKGHQFQFGCEICAKPLGSYSAFIAHKRLHDPNQSGYTCEHCGKVLLFKATLEAHIRSVHSDAKDFRCEQCEKGFKTQAQLNNHMISHTKEKPYQCQICGYAVKRKDSLRQHMYRHAEVKPYRCGRCGKEYTQKQALEIHLKSKHAGVTTFNCTMCERGFNTNYLLKKHMQKAHEVELVNKMPRSDQVIIAQQQIEDAADSEPPAPGESGVLAPVAKKQTVLINAHICEHCHEVFVSQHALAVHILSEHMNQSRVNADEDVGSMPTNEEDGQVVNISETIEIPIGEEMVLVQSVEPGVLSAALEKGATRVISNDNSTPLTGKSRTVSLLSARNGEKSNTDIMDDEAHIVVTDATLEDEQQSDSEEMRIIEVSGAVVEEEVSDDNMRVIEVSVADVQEQEVTTSEVTDSQLNTESIDQVISNVAL